MKKVRVTKRRGLFWYSGELGKEFTVASETDTAYWVYTVNKPNPVDWILKEDCEVV